MASTGQGKGYINLPCVLGTPGDMQRVGSRGHWRLPPSRLSAPRAVPVSERIAACRGCAAGLLSRRVHAMAPASECPPGHSRGRGGCCHLQAAWEEGHHEPARGKPDGLLSVRVGGRTGAPSTVEFCSVAIECRIPPSPVVLWNGVQLNVR